MGFFLLTMEIDLESLWFDPYSLVLRDWTRKTAGSVYVAPFGFVAEMLWHSAKWADMGIF
jgi:hypothetical protein